MKIVSIFLLTAAICLASSVDVSWQEDSIEVAMQEALATETCEGCSDCFKDKWQGAGATCGDGNEDDYYCGAIQQVDCGTEWCPITYCYRPCYEPGICGD